MHPSEIRAAFTRGENITELLRRTSGSDVNTEEIIETAYDLQTGAYVASLEDEAFYAHKVEYGEAIAETLTGLVGDGGSVLEPGVGEGTTLSFVAESCRGAFDDYHGFDISWSRIAKSREWLASRNVDAFLSVASIFHAPYADDSFDVVYTSHTVEPNGGREAPILQELYRVASRYLVLLEPGYEFAAPEAQARMTRLGYVRNLADHARSLGMKVVRNELFGLSANPLNPTAITVIEKNPAAAKAVPQLVCPNFGDELHRRSDCFYSPGSLRAYPTILGIPCLRQTDSVIASHFNAHAPAADA